MIQVQAEDVSILQRNRKRDRLKKWLHVITCRTIPDIEQDPILKPVVPATSLTRTPTNHPPLYALQALCIQEDPRRLMANIKLTKIGQGRSGAVFRTGPGKAVKEIKVPLRTTLCTRLLSEIQALKELNDHPNIIRLHNSYLFSTGADKKVWLECEEASEGQLTPLLTRFKMTEAQISVVMRQLLSALQYMHSKGWVHRDVKSDNLFVHDDGRIVLGDFGAALKYSDGACTDSPAIQGTPHWMAPESIINNEYSPGSDLWSAGIVMFEMVVGEPPLWQLSQKEAVDSISQFTRLDVAPIRGSEVMKDLLKMLVAKKEDRINMSGALQHQFITMYEDQSPSILVSTLAKSKRL